MTQADPQQAARQTRPGWQGRAVLPPSGLAGLLLDIDDTLLTTREAMHRAATAATLAVWPDADPGRLGSVGRRYRDDPGGHFRAYTRGEHDLETMRSRRVADLATWLEVDFEDEHGARWRDHFDTGLMDGITVFEDVLPALEAAWDAGIPVALLTNAGVDITRDKLRRCRLDELLQARSVPLVTKDSLGIGKPAPEVFHHGCELIDRDPSTVAYVGDELDVDPVAAIDAGLGGAWVLRDGYAVSQADLDLAESRGLAPFTCVDEAVAALLHAGAPGFGSTARAR